MQTIYVFPTTNKSYQKVTFYPKARRNIGIIEDGGYLNVKPELRAMIRKAGGSFTRAPGFNKTRGGSTHGVGGTGYDSYANFGGVAAAKAFLNKYFNVK